MELPKSWDKVTLKQYIQVAEVSAIDMDELDKYIKILSILSGVDEDKIIDLTPTQIKESVRQIKFIYTQAEKKPIKTTIRLGVNKYEINTNLKKLTIGEYIDLAELTKDKHSVTSNLPKIIALFFKPINWFGFPVKKHYNNGVQTIESRARTAKLLEDNLMTDDAMTLSGFFLSNWNSLMQATLRYSEQQNKKIAKELNKAIEKDLHHFGAGT